MNRKCHDPSGCPEPGAWHNYPRRYGKGGRIFLCDEHWAQWFRHILDFPSTTALQASIAAHPASYEGPVGDAAVAIWRDHEDDCTCLACGWVNFHMDEVV